MINFWITQVLAKILLLDEACYNAVIRRHLFQAVHTAFALADSSVTSTLLSSEVNLNRIPKDFRCPDIINRNPLSYHGKCLGLWIYTFALRWYHVRNREPDWGAMKNSLNTYHTQKKLIEATLWDRHNLIYINLLFHDNYGRVSQILESSSVYSHTGYNWLRQHMPKLDLRVDQLEGGLRAVQTYIDIGHKIMQVRVKPKHYFYLFAHEPATFNPISAIVEKFKNPVEMTNPCLFLNSGTPEDRKYTANCWLKVLFLYGPEIGAKLVFPQLSQVLSAEFLFWLSWHEYSVCCEGSQFEQFAEGEYHEVQRECTEFS